VTNEVMPVRVLVVTSLFASAPLGEVAQAALAQLASLAELGAQVTLLGPPPAVWPSVEGLSARPLRVVTVPWLGDGVAVPLLLASLAGHLELASEHDVILGQWAFPDVCAAALFAVSAGKPCVAKFFTDDLAVLGKRKIPNRYMRNCFPFARAYVATDASQVRRLMWKGCERGAIHVIPDGFAPRAGGADERHAARQRLGLGEGALALCASSAGEEGVGELLQAFTDVVRRRPDARLALVGEGRLVGKVRAAGKRLRGSLLLPGPVSHERLKDWMTAADVVVVPRWSEASQKVIAEAFAAMRPVVCGATRGSAHGIRDGKDGIVSRPEARDLTYSILAGFARKWEARELEASRPLTPHGSATMLSALLDEVVRESAVNGSARP
jgi:glycosyltransferase involved in cell wall biosynthesis